MAEPEERPARAGTGRRIAKWIAIGLGAIVLLVGALLLGIDTGPGHRFLTRQIAAYETASGIRIGVDRIEGSVYGRMALVGFTVSDPRGVFARSPRVEVDWSPFAYLNNKIDVRTLHADEVRLMRLPALKPVPSDPNAPLLPDLDIALGRLTVDRLIVDPPVTGKRHLVRLDWSADIADGRARIRAAADALRGPGVAGGDRLRMTLDAVPQANRLQVDGRLTAPAGGLVDSYAGLGKPLELSVGGNGDWANWAGRARALLGGQPLADLAITARDGNIRARGATQPGALMEGPVRRLTSPALDIDLAAVLGERRADVKLVARSSALAVNAAGLFDLGQSRIGNLRIDAQLLTPGAIADNLAGRDVRLAAVIDGPFATPTLDYRLTASRLAFGTMGVDALVASGRATIDADRILIPVNATARRVTGLNAAAGGLLTNLAINGDLAYSNGRLLSDNLKLRSDRIDATAIIVADIAKGTYTGALKGRVNDYQVDGLGRINLFTDAELVTGPNGGFGIAGFFRANTVRLDNASVRDQLGGNAVVSGRFGFDENGIATLRQFTLTAPLLRITSGEGRYDTATGRIAFRAAGQSRTYGPLSVVATGTLERPLVTLRAARPNVGVQLTDVVAELRGTAAGYEISARGGSPYGPFVADLLVRTGRGPLAVDIRRATFAGIDFTGSVVQTAAGPFAGTVRVAGSGLNGSLRLAAAGSSQRIDADIAASAARIPGDVPILIGRGTIRGTAILYPAGPSVEGRFDLANVVSGDNSLTIAQGRASYRNGSGSVALVARGRAGVPFDVAAQARLSPNRVLANLRGTANGIAFRLARPATIVKAGADWQLQPATIVVPQGQVDLAGSYGSATRLTARLRNMDVAIVQAAVPGLGLGGRATGTIDYASAGTVPSLRARIDVKNFTRTAAYVVSQPVDIAFLGTLGESGGEARALIRRGGTTVGRMQARLAPLGAGASLSDRLFASPLGGGIRYNGPAEVLWTLTGIAGQTVSGPIAVAADFGGRLDQPSLNGVVRANALRYENEAYGTVVSRIALDGRFTRSRLQINTLTGRAGEGSVSAKGSVGLDAASGFPIDLAVSLQRAQLARSDALGATVSGNLAITNGAGGGLIKGELSLPEVRYQIIRQGAAEIAELEGVRRRTDRPLSPAQQQAAIPSNWALDIRVRADNRVFISGMGLEAEFATDLRVRGTSTAPVVTGSVDVVRGTYSFSGRRFELADNGTIRFDGGPLTNPILSLAANTTVEGVTATINIGGRALAPQISFTSTPALPQDEVLSRLLFGSSITSLSPTQAIQLAAALNSLRGSGGGGLNPLGKLRSASGIDRLRVLGADKTAGRGTALAAGQYISNDIYVEIITDARGFTATQLEISLSKALSLLSQTSSFGGSSVNLRYSKDY